MGSRLKAARVVFLFLSPGFSQKDLKEAKTIGGKNHYIKKRKGILPLSESGPGADWFNRVVKSFELNSKIVREKIAVLNIGAYHSKKFTDYPFIGCSTFQSRFLRMGTKSFISAGNSRRACCRLSTICAFLGTGEGKKFGRALFAPEATRGGHMKRRTKKQKEMRNKVIAAVKKAVK
jgi:hypothetical protein